MAPSRYSFGESKTGMLFKSIIDNPPANPLGSSGNKRLSYIAPWPAICLTIATLGFPSLTLSSKI